MTVAKMWRHPFQGRTFRVTVPVLGLICLLSASSMVAPLGIAIWRAEYDRLALGASIIISAALGFGLFHLRGRGFQNLRHREAILAVAGSWIAVATGGFSTRNASVGAYGSFYIEVVIVAFMILGSLPFGVHY